MSEQRDPDELLVVYPFAAPVRVGVGVVGLLAPSRIAGEPVQVHLPRRLAIDSPVLVRPQVLDHLPVESDYSDGRDPEDTRDTSPWGYITDWDSDVGEGRIFAITSVVIAFKLGGRDARAVVESCLEALPSWFGRVKDQCEILSRQDMDHTAPRKRLEVLGAGWAAWHGQQRVAIPQRLLVDLKEDGDSLDSQQWVAVLERSGHELEPPPEHLLLRDARAAHARGQYRRAILDAGTALELGLSRILLQQYYDQPTPLGAELIRQAERMTLGKLRETLQKLTVLPPLTTDTVIRIRNGVVHQKATSAISEGPTANEADLLLEAATEAIAIASPLDE